MKLEKTCLAASVAMLLGTTALPTAVSAGVGLADGIYDMVINNTPYIAGAGYDIGSDGAWNSSFTVGCLPGSKGCASHAMYDDTAAAPAHGQYSGNVGDGVSGTVRIQVSSGVITGLGTFEFDTIPGTVGGNFVEYNGSANWSGSIDALGNITLTPTGTLATMSDLPSLANIDARWNVDDFNGGSGSGTNFVPNPPSANVDYDAFSTGSATNGAGTINGAAYDGTRAVLVKGGTFGSDWQGLGIQYTEIWNVSFIPLVPPEPGTGSIVTMWASSTNEAWVRLSSVPDAWIKVNEKYNLPVSNGTGGLVLPVLQAARAHHYGNLSMTLSPYFGDLQMDQVSLTNQINFGTPGTVSSMETSDNPGGIIGWTPLFVTVPEPTPNGDFGFYVTSAGQAAIAAEALMTGAQITYQENCSVNICDGLLSIQIDAPSR